LEVSEKMKNYIQPGNNLTLVATAAVVAGQGLLVGSLFGVVQGAAAIGAEFVLCRQGVYELPKTAGTAWAVGDKLYWDDTAKEVTKTVGSNKLIGVAVAVAASAATVGEVLLDGAAR
jgi:predicted RecA/RadA family phage recombinase